MPKWKYTARTSDMSGNTRDTFAGEVSGPHPAGARDAVRQHIEEQEPQAWRVEVSVQDPGFD